MMLLLGGRLEAISGTRQLSSTQGNSLLLMYHTEHLFIIDVSDQLFFRFCLGDFSLLQDARFFTTG